VANLIYERVSTDQQSTARQNLVLDEAGIENPVVFEEDPAPPAASTRSSARSCANC
jgi:DNA invertase Pin-like site-specific DNA recombinase